MLVLASERETSHRYGRGTTLQHAKIQTRWNYLDCEVMGESGTIQSKPFTKPKCELLSTTDSQNRGQSPLFVAVVTRCTSHSRCGGSAGDSHQQVDQASGLTERRSARPRFGNKPGKRSIEKHSKDEVEKGCGPRSHITQSGPHVAKVSSKFMHDETLSSILSQGSKGTSA